MLVEVLVDLEAQVDCDHNNYLIHDCSHQHNHLVFDGHYNYIHHSTHNHRICNPLNYTRKLKKQEILKCRDVEMCFFHREQAAI